MRGEGERKKGGREEKVIRTGGWKRKGRNRGLVASSREVLHGRFCRRFLINILAAVLYLETSPPPAFPLGGEILASDTAKYA